MDEFFLQHLIIQIFLTLPMLIVFWQWKKASKILRFIVITFFLLTVPSLWQTAFHNPINYSLDLSHNQTERVYEFTILPGIRGPFVVGYQISISSQTTSEISSEKSDWPQNKDVQVVTENGDWSDSDDINFQRYNIENNHFLFGKIVKFDEPLNMTKVKYVLNSRPPENINHINLILESVYFNDSGIGFYLNFIWDIILVYGSTGLYFLIILLFRRFEKSKK